MASFSSGIGDPAVDETADREWSAEDASRDCDDPSVADGGGGTAWQDASAMRERRIAGMSAEEARISLVVSSRADAEMERCFCDDTGPSSTSPIAEAARSAERSRAAATLDAIKHAAFAVAARVAVADESDGIVSDVSGACDAAAACIRAAFCAGSIVGGRTALIMMGGGADGGGGMRGSRGATGRAARRSRAAIDGADAVSLLLSEISSRRGSDGALCATIECVLRLVPAATRAFGLAGRDGPASRAGAATGSTAAERTDALVEDLACDIARELASRACDAAAASRAAPCSEDVASAASACSHAIAVAYLSAALPRPSAAPAAEIASFGARDAFAAVGIVPFDPGPVNYVPDVVAIGFRGRAVCDVRCRMAARVIEEYTTYINSVAGTATISGMSGGPVAVPFSASR